MIGAWFSVRVVGLAVVVAMALGVVACGSGEDGGGGDGASTSQADGRAASDEEQIDAVLRTTQRQMVAGDSDAACAAMSSDGRRDLVEYGRQVGLGASCEAVVRATAKSAAASDVKQKPTRLLAVRVRGDEATAMVTNGGRPPEALEFTKEDGQWKMPALGAGGVGPGLGTTP